MNLEKAKMTAETRLYNRLKRPGDENCKDLAQSGYLFHNLNLKKKLMIYMCDSNWIYVLIIFSLISEVQNLEDQLKTLNYQLQCARTGHLGLQDARSQLEDEARIKRKTIWIDTVRCQNVRAHYPSQNILIGH